MTDFANIKKSIPVTVDIHLELLSAGGKLYDSDGNPSIISLYGPSSDQAVSFGRNLADKLSYKVAKKGMKGLRTSAIEMEKQNVARLLAYTANVSGVVFDGEVVDAKSIKKLYEDPDFGWMVKQLEDKLGSWDDFLEGQSDLQPIISDTQPG